MGLIENKQELFQIAKKFANKTATPADVMRLAEILCYDNPYPNKYFQTVKPEEMTISENSSVQSANGDVTLGSHQEGTIQSTTLNSGNKGQIKINIVTSISLNAEYLATQSFYEVVNTIAHEMRHEHQSRLLREHILEGKESDPELQLAVDTFSYGASNQSNLGNLLKLAYIAGERELSADVMKEFMLFQGDDTVYSDILKPNDPNYPSKKYIEEVGYLQLKYEEDARMAGVNFALELFLDMYSDEMCPEELKEYLEEVNAEGEDNLFRENRRNDSKDYNSIRKLFMNAKKIVDKTSTKDIADIINDHQVDYILKKQIADMKLFNLRENKTDMATYYRAVCTYRMYRNNLSNDRASYYYLAGCDPKEIMLQLLSEAGKEYEDGLNMQNNPITGANAVKNLNFLNPAQPIYLNTDEITELILSWFEQKNLKAVDELFSELKYPNLSDVASKERYKTIASTLKKDERINKHILDNMPEITKILSKDPSKMLYAEYLLLNEVRYNIGILADTSVIAQIAEYMGLSDEECRARIKELKLYNNISRLMGDNNGIHSQSDDRLLEITNNDMLKLLKKNSAAEELRNPTLLLTLTKMLEEPHLFSSFSSRDMAEYVNGDTSGLLGYFLGSRIKDVKKHSKENQKDLEKLEKAYTKYLYDKTSSPAISKLLKERKMKLKDFEKYLESLESGEIDPKFNDLDVELRRGFILKTVRKAELSQIRNQTKIEAMVALARSGKFTMEDIEEFNNAKMTQKGKFEEGSKFDLIQKALVEEHKAIVAKNETKNPNPNAYDEFLKFITDPEMKDKIAIIVQNRGLTEKDFEKYVEYLENQELLPSKELEALEDNLKDAFAFYNAQKEVSRQTEEENEI